MQTDPKAPVPYDSSIHVKNASGRWVDKETKKLASIDKATIPPEAAQAPSRPVETTLQGVLPPPVVEVAPASPGPTPAPSPSPAPSILRAGEGVAPIPARPQSFDASMIEDLDALPPSLGMPGAGPLPHEHVHGCYAGQGLGRQCACGVVVYDPMPSDEAEASAGIMIGVINRFSTNPKDPSEAEIKQWSQALILCSTRYGNPLAKYAPLLALGFAVVPSVMERRAPKLEEGAPAQQEGAKGTSAPPAPVERSLEPKGPPVASALQSAEVR